MIFRHGARLNGGERPPGRGISPTRSFTRMSGLASNLLRRHVTILCLKSRSARSNWETAMLNIVDWRKRSLKMGFAVAALTAAGAMQTSGALAQTRAETLIVVAEEGPASLDIDVANANVPTHEVSWNIYDRLITHGMKKLPDGTP